MQNVKLLAGVIVGTLVLVFGVAFLFSGDGGGGDSQIFDEKFVVGDGRNSTTGGALAGLEVESGEDGEVVDASVSADAGSSLITLTEFSDFQCPACLAAEPVIMQLLATYPDRVKLVYRHFPLETIHKNARAAAIVSEFMADQGLFWPFHDLLFENQSDWADEGDPMELFGEYIVEVGGSVEGLGDALDNDEYNRRVDTDIGDGLGLGVNSTPSLFVDGERVDVVGLSGAIEARL